MFINYNNNLTFENVMMLSDILFLILSSILMILLGSLLTIKNGINFAFSKVYIIAIIYSFLIYIVLSKNILLDNIIWDNILSLFILSFLLILYTYIDKKNVRATFEYPIIYLISFIGMLIILKSNDLFIWFLAIEMSSFSFYSLAAYKTNRSFLQTEAGLKYFLFGAIASSLYLFGTSMFYLIFGTLQWDSIVALSYFPLANSYIFYGGLLLIFISLFFKLGIAPFHFWLPVVYTNSSSIVTYMFIFLPKIALLYLLFKFSILNFSYIMFFPALASLILGTIFAFKSTNLKTFLAYSSISNAAFFMAPLFYQSVFSFYSLIFYIFSYNILVTIAFLPILFVKRANNSNALSNLRDIIILKKSNPLLAIYYALMALSFAGVPPLLGFFSKLFILFSTLSFSAYFLTGILLAFSLIASYYYLRLLKIIYFPFALKYAAVMSMPIIPAMLISIFSIVNIFFICLPTYISIMLNLF
jgi:NADH-quinone oxidoreductase subunit N